MTLRGSSLPGSNLNRSSPTFYLDNRSIYDRYEKISQHIDAHDSMRKTFNRSGNFLMAHPTGGANTFRVNQPATGYTPGNDVRPNFRASEWNKPETKGRWDYSDKSQTQWNKVSTQKSATQSGWRQQDKKSCNPSSTRYDWQNSCYPGKPIHSYPQPNSMNMTSQSSQWPTLTRTQEIPTQKFVPAQQVVSKPQAPQQSALSNRIQETPKQAQLNPSIQQPVYRNPRFETQKENGQQSSPATITNPRANLAVSTPSAPKFPPVQPRQQPQNQAPISIPKQEESRVPQYQAPTVARQLEEPRIPPYQPPALVTRPEETRQPQNQINVAEPKTEIVQQQRQEAPFSETNQGEVKQNQAVSQPSNGGLKTDNKSSADNPFNTMTQEGYDYYARVNAEAAKTNPIRQAPGGGGLKPGNVSSEDNPFNTMTRQGYDYYTKMSQDNAASNPLKVVQGSGGTGNVTSQDNPLNSLNQQDYNRYSSASQAIAQQNPLRIVQGAGGTGNVTSQDNPLNTLNQNEYNRYTNLSQAAAQENPLRKVQGAGGTGNVTSSDNPLHPSNYNERMVRFADDFPEQGQQSQPYNGGGGLSQSRPSGVVDEYANLSPKERLAAKRRDHYQQGSNTATARQPQYNKGGMGTSNDTSEGNPLSTMNPALLEHYKRVNTEMVNQNPIKKNSKGQRIGGGGGMGGMGGGQGGDDGVVKKRGGIAMNL